MTRTRKRGTGNVSRINNQDPPGRGLSIRDQGFVLENRGGGRDKVDKKVDFRAEISPNKEEGTNKREEKKNKNDLLILLIL